MISVDMRCNLQGNLSCLVMSHGPGLELAGGADGADGAGRAGGAVGSGGAVAGTGGAGGPGAISV